MGDLSPLRLKAQTPLSLMGAALVVLLTISGPRSACAAGSSSPTVVAAATGVGAVHGPELAETLTITTGIAITPLAGTSAVGAWQYLTTPENRRASLPWFSSPWFWVPGLALFCLLRFKDLLPKSIKLPFEAMELLEHKASAVLVGLPAILPMAYTSVSPPEAIGPLAVRTAGLAGVLGGVGIALVAATVFVAVFVVSQAVNVVILLSPSSTLDNVLNLFKGSVVLVIVLATATHPLLGLLVSLVVFLVSLFLFSVAWRMTLLGTVLAWDVLTFRHRRKTPDPSRLLVFVGRPVRGTKRLALGWLELGDELTFHGRARFGLARRSVKLAREGVLVEEGLLIPTISAKTTDGTCSFWLAPRYRGHEPAISAAGALPPPLAPPIQRGVRGMIMWMRRLLARMPTHGA